MKSSELQNFEDTMRRLKRYGLVLAYPKVIPAIPCRGKQGIWYYDIPASAPGEAGKNS